METRRKGAVLPIEGSDGDCSGRWRRAADSASARRATLFDVRRAMGAGGPSRYFYDVAGDGQRFLVGMRTDEGLPDPERGQAAGSISLLLNWPGSLTRK